MTVNTEKVVAVIPARGASKGLSRKNVLPLGGKPLIAWTIEAARQCPLVDWVIVSTDDAEIASVAQEFGAAVPFMRPAELASDTASTESVLMHAVEWIEGHESKSYDILVYLQVTDPFRSKNIIERVVRALIDNPDLDSVFAARPEHKNYWTYQDGQYRPLGRHCYLPRQQKPLIFREDTGTALATRIDVIKQGRRIGERVEIIPHEGVGDEVDIHDEFDLWLANQIIEVRGVKPNG